MAVEIDATLSGEFSNSYVTEVFADEYFEQHYITSKTDQWSALSSEQKSLLLVNACFTLEKIKFVVTAEDGRYRTFYDRNSGTVRYFNYDRTPVRYSSIQALQFPRNLDVDSTDGTRFIPDPIKNAQCEQAIYLLNFDEAAVSSALQGIKAESFSLGRGQIVQSVEYLGGGRMNVFAPLSIELCHKYFVNMSGKLRRA